MDAGERLAAESFVDATPAKDGDGSGEGVIPGAPMFAGEFALGDDVEDRLRIDGSATIYCPGAYELLVTLETDDSALSERPKEA